MQLSQQPSTSKLATPPPCIQIEAPSSDYRETTFNVVVEINEINTPSTSTQESNTSRNSAKCFIDMPNKNFLRKKVRWEKHRLSEESISRLYPYQKDNASVNRDSFRRNFHRTSDDFDTRPPPIIRECANLIKLILLVSCCSIAVFAMQCLMYLSYVALSGESIIDEIFKEREASIIDLYMAAKNRS